MEIDAVIGINRLPDFSDMDALLYTNAIVKEAMRWQPVTPLGGLIKLLSDFQLLIVLTVVHMCTADDEYHEYFIPKDTIVMGNICSVSLYSINNQPIILTVYRRVILQDLEQDPDSAAFGFGRRYGRKCYVRTLTEINTPRIWPGRHLSNNSLYAVVSSVLAVFDIRPPLDEDRS